MISPADAKRILLAFLIALVALTLLAPAPVFAQEGDPTDETLPADTEPAPPDESRPLTVTSVTRDPETGEVMVEAVTPVALAGGRLPESSFSVLANDSFQEFSYSPVSTDAMQIVLVLDVSGSMLGEPLEAAKLAAISFINRLPATVRVGVITFDGSPDVIAEIGTPFDEVMDRISTLQVGGETALFDALMLASEEVALSPSTRSVVIALTDGADSASTATPDDVARELDLGQIELHGVALNTPDTSTEDLANLTTKSRGSFTEAANAEALRPLYDDLAARLANRFVITFTPERESSTSALVVLSHSGVVASARTEYSALELAPATDSAPATQLEETIAAVSVAEPFNVGELGWIASRQARNIGLGLLAAMLLVTGLLLGFPSQRLSQLTQHGRERASNAKVSNLTSRLEDFADRRLERKGRKGRLTRVLERAGVDLRPGEFIVIAFASALGLAVASSLFVSWAGALIVFAMTLFGIRAWLSRKAEKRIEAFLEQLPATLQLMAGTLRAGYALPQTAETVAAETDSPTSDEFHRLVTEHRLGRDFGEALDAMDERIQSEDFSWLVQALEIHRTVGGDLAEVLDNIHSTMRDRAFIRRQVASLSAESRYSAYLITSLPFVVAGLLFITSPDYIGLLFEGFRGFAVLALAGLSIFTGSYWMKLLMKETY